ncbi:MAG: TonB-dependent receptor domain-containing protein [Chitinophaga sp.]
MNIRDLQPETSTSFNLGLTFNITAETEISVNGFYHNIRNLINTEQFGIMNNGQQLFSYININSVRNHLTNYLMPSQPGRVWMAGLEWRSGNEPLRPLKKISGG